MVPLAGPANKQARVAANNLAGGNDAYRGTQATAIAKVFDLSVASTGANEKSLVARGLARGKDYETVLVTQKSHADYYPGAVGMTIKLLFAADGQRLFGAQIVGGDGVDKRIDTLAVAIRLGASVNDLTELELAYAPPYSSAKDPVNMVGFVAQNVVRGLVRFAPWDPSKLGPDVQRVDVREPHEVAAWAVPQAKHIALGQLRERLGELQKDKTTVVYCAAGVRAYNASRILAQHGYKDVLIYPGGAGFLRLMG